MNKPKDLMNPNTIVFGSPNRTFCFRHFTVQGVSEIRTSPDFQATGLNLVFGRQKLTFLTKLDQLIFFYIVPDFVRSLKI